MLSEIFQIYLPVADISVNSLILLVIGLFSGFFSGLFGMGGGVISVPILISIGIEPQVVVASSSNQMVAAASSSFLGYARRGRVDYKLGLLLLTGGVAGTIIGVFLFDIISTMGKLDFTVSICFIVILSMNVIFTLREVTKKTIGKNYKNKSKYIYWIKKISLPMQRKFISSKKSISIFSPIIAGFFGGMLVSILGIGGALITIPIMLYMLQVSSLYTVGISHFQTMFTAIIAVIFHSITNQSIDIILSIILIIGIVIGVQIGIRFGIGFTSRRLKILFSIFIFILCSLVCYRLLATPDNIYLVEFVQ